MQRRMDVAFLLAGSFASLLAFGAPGKPVVQVVAGVHVGTETSDPDVVGMFGPGCFVRDEGHGGGRYFIDTAGTVTLHTVIGVDGMTEQVELSVSRKLPSACTGSTTVVSEQLPAAPLIEHGLHFGMTRSDLIAALGQPTSEKVLGTTVALLYKTDRDADPGVELEYEATFRFEHDRLMKVSVYDGESGLAPSEDCVGWPLCGE